MKEAIEQFFVREKYYHPYSKGRKTIPTEEVLDIIDTAPAANEMAKTKYERPQGEWIVENDVYCICSVCNNKEIKFSNFCPNCGAQMVDFAQTGKELRDNFRKGCGLDKCGGADLRGNKNDVR